ncbi:Putative protein [Zobellia galactanivorans]|uniref:Uncharacterized protein n=1 Tax=Zobellia galactanivorans (strain DSM 12802 / CCUG 47099 / CIP 106680 / NCIMB 13871 / Dsij) TaxID=63186 RepID=G0LCP6_ZOBGA|nr:Putative protein [Zobellia galactanivorans]
MLFLLLVLKNGKNLLKNKNRQKNKACSKKSDRPY